ncbi:MAG: glycoside hydrolase [Bacteroidota bacterium]
MSISIKSLCLILLNIFFIEFISTANVTDTLVTVLIDINKKTQTIENFGSSGCWFSEGIGKYWPKEKKDKIADLLFSKKFDRNGKPEGIGLSAWRFNIGAGTMEQGDSSGIRDFRKRSDSFLNPDGTYDWTKQVGQRFFLQKAKDYGVETLIGFSNSPPVQFTKNGLGFKTEKDYKSNLKDDSYPAYAKFLATVVKKFDQMGLHFSYLSPVNEPQWDWSHKYKEASQEGSPWRNEEIYHIAKELNAALESDKLTTKILLTEAGQLTYLYGDSGPTSHQIQTFFDPKSAMFVGNFKQVPKLIAGHSYFSEANNDMLKSVRTKLAAAVKSHGIHYWQSEYSMLADGFRENSKAPRSAMDCALFLSKVIHADLTIGNATAWQFWNAYEPGRANINTRYYLIALQPNPDFKDGEFVVTKNLWALGHYSRFIRPGMTRVNARTDNSDLLLSAFVDKSNKIVIVATNYGTRAINTKFDLGNKTRKYRSVQRYLTSSNEEDNMKPEIILTLDKPVELPARSISTFVLN